MVGHFNRLPIGLTLQGRPDLALSAAWLTAGLDLVSRHAPAYIAACALIPSLSRLAIEARRITVLRLQEFYCRSISGVKKKLLIQKKKKKKKKKKKRAHERIHEFYWKG